MVLRFGRLRGVGWLLLVTALLTPAMLQAQHTVVVSIPALHLKEGERIVGFEFQVHAARIAGVTDAPIGWDVSIDNDPSWNTSLKANVLVGAAALDARFFNGFLRIEKEDPALSPFGISGSVYVTRDFAETREIKLESKDFRFAPVGGETKGR